MTLIPHYFTNFQAMANLELHQSDRSRKCFQEILKHVEDKNSKKVIEDIASKEILSKDDIDHVRKAVPPHVPAVFGLLFEFRRVREDDYKASPEFRAKTERLRLKFEHQEYKKLVETVDPAQGYGVTPMLADFGSDMRSMNRQLGTIFNFLVTVVGGFFFGFTGITYAYPSREFDLATRFMLGLVIATVIFFADLYFVIKNMDEELSARPNAASGKGKANTFDLKKLNQSTDAGSKAKDKNLRDKKND